MEFSQEEFDEIINIFNEESDEIIHRLNNNILLLEKNPKNKELIAELFRDAHSLKGASRMIGFNDIQTLTHKIEDILGLAKENKITISAGLTDTIYKTIDFVGNSIQLSIRAKKEVKSNEYGKYLTMLERIIQAPYIKPEAEEIDNTESTEFLKTLKKEEKNVNAKLVEIIYLLDKLNQTPDSIYLAGLKEAFEWINPFFVQAEDYGIKRNLADILLKLDFVSQSSGILTAEEIAEINIKLEETIDAISAKFEKEGLEKINYKELAFKKKQRQDKTSIENLNNINHHSENGKQSNELFNTLIQNIKQLDSDPEKITNIIEFTKKLAEESPKNEIAKVFKKITEIFETIQDENIRPDKEILNILRQSIQSGEKLFLDKQGNDKEDTNLLLQRLSITQQIISLSKPKETTEEEDRTETEKPLSVVDLPSRLIVKNRIEQPQDFLKFFESSAIKTLRVDTQKLDKLVNQVGEVIISKIKTKKHVIELETINSNLKELLDEATKSISYLKYYDKKLSSNEKDFDMANYASFNKQLLMSITENNDRLNSQIQEISNLYKNMQEDDTKLNFVVTKLEQMVKDIRLLPLATIFHMIPRMIRDIAKEKGKEIDLSILGSETNVDKKIIDEIKTPLIHIIRNAIDHGIETPEERIKKNKPPTGKILLSAKHIENKIVIEIEDDGNGVDIARIKEKALEKGFLTQEEINVMNDEQIMNLIFWPGFTTEDNVTNISGRGIGLDVVQTKISQLNGKVTVKSVLSKGTKVTIALPVTMATIKSFILQLNGQFYAMAMSAIKFVLKVDVEDIFTKDDRYNILYQKKSIPIFDLSKSLGFEQYNTSQKKRTVIVVESENTTVGFIVDKLVGDQEILNKKLDPPLFKLKNISGITTLITGESCLIINISELIKTIFSGDYKISTSKNKLIDNKFTKNPQDYNILVVDDSITTRTLMRNILNAVGYNVTVVKDALEGIDAISHRTFDLVITDVEMPEMDGFEFSKKIKENPTSSQTPIIVVTSNNTEENQQKAKDAKTDIFVSKSDFNQQYFLSSVEYILSKKKYIGQENE